MTRLHVRYQQAGTRNRPRPGQQPVTTPRQGRSIVRLHIRDRTLPVVRIAPTVQGQLGVIRADTVCHRRRSAVCSPPYVGPVLTDRHRNERRRWAGRYRHWSLQRWHGLLFSDESFFHWRNADGRLRVWRKFSQWLPYINRWGGGSVMVWDGISYHCRGRMNAIYYQYKSILLPPPPPPTSPAPR